MTNVTIDNSATDELGKVVLWQYDKATNLLSLLSYLGNWYTISVEEFWNAYPSKVIGVDTADSFGLSVWGTFLGLPRPTYRVPTTSSSNTNVSVTDDLYRRVLKARFYLMKSTASINELAYYLSLLFGCQRYTGESGVFVTDLGEMAMSYSHNTNSPALYLSGTAHSVGEVLAVVTIYQVKSGKSIEDGTPWSEVEEQGLVEELSNAQQSVSAYENGTAYSAGEFLTNGGLVYRCNQSFTATTWNDDSSQCTLVPCYVDPSSYSDFVYETGVAYSAADSDGNFADYVLHDYEVQEGAPYGGKVYICNTDIAASANTSWDAVSSSFTEISGAYSAGSYLCRIRVLRVTEDIPVGTARTDIFEKTEEVAFRNSNVKTPLNVTYWDDMTKEQQLLYESANSVASSYLEDSDLDKARELLPYPAGVRYNTPFDEVVFGFDGQEPAELDDSSSTDVVLFANTVSNENGSTTSSTEGAELTTDGSSEVIVVNLGNVLSQFTQDPAVGSFCEDSAAVRLYSTTDSSYSAGSVFKDSDGVVYYTKTYFGVGREASSETSGDDKRFKQAKSYSETGEYEVGDAVCNGTMSSSASFAIVKKRIGPSRYYLDEVDDGFLLLLKEGFYTDATTKAALSKAYVESGRPCAEGERIDESSQGSGIYLVDGIKYTYDTSLEDPYYTRYVSFHGTVNGVAKWTDTVSWGRGTDINYQTQTNYTTGSVLRIKDTYGQVGGQPPPLDVLGVVLVQIGNPGTYAACMDADRTMTSAGTIAQYSQSSTYNIGNLMYSDLTSDVYVCTRYIGNPRSLEDEIEAENVAEAWNKTTFISSYLPSRWNGE